MNFFLYLTIFHFLNGVSKTPTSSLFNAPLAQYQVDVEGFPPAVLVVYSGVVAEQVHLAPEEGLRPIVEALHLLLLCHVTPEQLGLFPCEQRHIYALIKRDIPNHQAVGSKNWRFT